jgi:hypothetical protein
VSQELLRGARLDRFAGALAQFGVVDATNLAESKHDDTFLKFNVGLDDPSDLARFKQLRDAAKAAHSGSASVSDEAAQRSFDARRRAEEAAFSAARETTKEQQGRRASAAAAPSSNRTLQRMTSADDELLVSEM